MQTETLDGTGAKYSKPQVVGEDNEHDIGQRLWRQAIPVLYADAEQ